MYLKPKVSVIMPVYNTDRYITSAIDSVLSQTLIDFEFIIIDDGSTDSTQSIINSYSDNRIRYIKNSSNKGLVYSLNKAISLCRGIYIARMDADDINLPERFAKQVKYLEQHSDVIMLGTAVEYFGNTEFKTDLSNIQYDEEIRVNLITKASFFHPTVMFKAEVLYKNLDLRYNANKVHVEDYDLWIKMLKYGKLANLNEVLLKYRWHGDNISIKHKTHQQKESFVIRELYLKSIFSIFDNFEIRLLTKLATGNLHIDKKNTSELNRVIKIIINEPSVSDLLKERFLQLYFLSFTSSTSEGPIILSYFNDTGLNFKHIGWYAKIKFFIKALIYFK